MNLTFFKNMSAIYLFKDPAIRKFHYNRVVLAFQPLTDPVQDNTILLSFHFRKIVAKKNEFK